MLHFSAFLDWNSQCRTCWPLLAYRFFGCCLKSCWNHVLSLLLSPVPCLICGSVGYRCFSSSNSALFMISVFVFSFCFGWSFSSPSLVCVSVGSRCFCFGLMVEDLFPIFFDSSPYFIFWPCLMLCLRLVRNHGDRWWVTTAMGFLRNGIFGANRDSVKSMTSSM